MFRDGRFRVLAAVVLAVSVRVDGGRLASLRRHQQPASHGAGGDARSVAAAAEEEPAFGRALRRLRLQTEEPARHRRHRHRPVRRRRRLARGAQAERIQVPARAGSHRRPAVRRDDRRGDAAGAGAALHHPDDVFRVRRRARAGHAASGAESRREPPAPRRRQGARHRRGARPGAAAGDDRRRRGARARRATTVCWPAIRCERCCWPSAICAYFAIVIALVARRVGARPFVAAGARHPADVLVRERPGGVARDLRSRGLAASDAVGRGVPAGAGARSQRARPRWSSGSSGARRSC